NWDRTLDQLLQRRSTALGLRRQDARRGLCYRPRAGEIGGVIETRIHLSQAAILSRKPGPPLSPSRPACRRCPPIVLLMAGETKTPVTEPAGRKIVSMTIR